MFSTLDDNQGGGDSQSISKTAHKLLPLFLSKHEPTLSPAECPVSQQREGGEWANRAAKAYTHVDSFRGWAKDLGLYSKHIGNSLKCFKQRGCMISFVFQKAHSGCSMEKKLNEIICVKASAQEL